MPDPTIQTVPLDRLEISAANVRKTGAGEAAHAELKASIAAHGLIENLVARPLAPDSQGKPRYAVIAGGRRLCALNELAEDGVLPEDHPVPCRVVRNGTDDAEISLAENVVRVAMHPADQVEAFGALALAGATVADIAARFGASERTVEQRLRLGHVAPELLDAYREDKIDLGTLKAFSVTTDRARQLAVWEQVSEQGYRPSDWQIKRMLTEDRVPAGAGLARFVGIDAYEAAGGPVLRDLFADEYENGVWLEDPALLNKLALERLQVAADELATRWKWSEARVDADWSDLARFGRVHPAPAQPTDGEKAEIEQLHVRHDELVNMEEDEWTDELVEESETIEQRLEDIAAAIEARALYRAHDMVIAGCIATVGNDGALQVVQGLVKPEDMPAKDTGDNTAATAAAAGEQQHGSGMTAPNISDPAMPSRPGDPQAEARKEAGVGIGLADDLRAIRTALVKAHLAQDFGAAFDLMLFQMGRAVFTPGYHDHALDIAVRETPERPPLRANDDTFRDSSPGEAMLADRSALPFDWLAIEDRAGSFAALRALSAYDKQRLFAACLARTLNGQLAFEAGARPETEATVARLDIDFAACVRPGAEMFWSRIRKDRMLAVARETLGLEWAHSHRKDKKATLATAMETAFAAGDARPLGVSKDGRAAALAWTPPGFAAFDSGQIDEGDTDGPAKSEAAAETPPDAAESVSTETSAPVNGDAADRVPGDLGAVIDAVNAVPTADGGPRVIISTVGFEDASQDDTSQDAPEGSAGPGAGAAMPPVPANGADSTAAGEEARDIPAFLRRS